MTSLPARSSGWPRSSHALSLPVLKTRSTSASSAARARGTCRIRLYGKGIQTHSCCSSLTLLPRLPARRLGRALADTYFIDPAPRPPTACCLFQSRQRRSPKMSGRRAQQTSQWRKQRIQVNPSQVPPKTNSLILTNPETCSSKSLIHFFVLRIWVTFVSLSVTFFDRLLRTTPAKRR